MGECPCWSDEHVVIDGVPVCGRCGRRKCPLCEGDGEVLQGASIYSRSLRPEIVMCPDCGGTGEAPDPIPPLSVLRGEEKTR